MRFGRGGKGGKGDKSGQSGSKSGSSSGNGGMGGPGVGQGGKPEYGEIDPTARTEVARGKLDPKGRISVTTFRGLPKNPGDLTPELKAAIRAARDEAEAPLEADQIPRRYREGIRGYFDDLGKTK